MQKIVRAINAPPGFRLSGCSYIRSHLLWIMVYMVHGMVEVAFIFGRVSELITYQSMNIVGII